MANRFVATDGSDGNGGTSIVDAYATLQMANDDVTLSPGDTVWLVVKQDANGVLETFSSEVGTVTIDTSGVKDNSISWKATNENGVVDGTMAVIDFSGVSLTNGGIHLQVSNSIFQNISVENTEIAQEGFLENSSETNNDAVGTRLTFFGCAARNCGHDGFSSNSTANIFYQCYASDCSEYFASGFRFKSGGGGGQQCFGCIAENCVQDGFDLDNVGGAWFCIANNNGVYGFRNASQLIHCNAVNNVDSGIYAETGVVFMNNISYGNGGYGIEIDPGASRNAKFMLNNAFGGNTFGTFDTYTTDKYEIEKNTIELGEDPFVDSSIRDFTLSNSEDGGQLCRNGATTTNRFVTATSYIDIGAVQSAARAIVVG